MACSVQKPKDIHGSENMLANLTDLKGIDFFFTQNASSACLSSQW